MVEKHIRIAGLDCMDFAKNLEASVAALPNVEEAQIIVYDGTLTVRGKVD